MRTFIARRRRVGSPCAAFAVAFVALAASAGGPFTTPNGSATLTVTYRLTGGGEDLPASHERHVTWSVDNVYVVNATMTANKPSGFAGMHKADAAEKTREDDRMKAANAAAADMQGMMAQAQQIVAACGDDEACIERETMKMSRGIDPDSAQMKSARSNIAKASTMPDARYQAFAAKQQSGTFRVAERSRAAYFDAGCSLATEARCLADTQVAGEGAQTDGNGKTTFLTGAVAEYDAATGSLIVGLPTPGLIAAKQVVASKTNTARAGTSTVRRVGVGSGLIGPIEVSCGDCRSTSGKLTRKVQDELLGKPATLEIEWKFARS